MAVQAGQMVDSCKRQGYEVWQFSDEKAPDVPGADKIERRPMDCPQVAYRYRWLRDIEPPYISLDVDLLVMQDISGMLDPEYDATMTVRENSDGMIYNGGVFSVQRRGFIEDCLAQIEQMPPEWQNWTGGQRAMVAARERWRLKELPCSTWNFSPQQLSEVRSHMRVLHFKGKRKSMMEEAYARLCA
jgi:hypothetical protein